MKLAEVYQGILEHDKKAAGTFKDMYTLHGYADNDPFTRYVLFIRDNTKEWYMNTLPTYKSESSASKLKTIINNILNPGKYGEIAGLVEEADRVLVSSKLAQTLKDLVADGHFKAKPKRRVHQPAIDDDVNEIYSIETGSTVSAEALPYCDGHDDLARKLAIAKRMLLMILESATPDENLKQISKLLVETFL